MKKNVLVKIGERMETRIRTIPAQYSEMGELIADAYDETYTVTVPVMEAQNVEMTAEEIAEMKAMQANTPAPSPTPEQRLDVLEGTTDDIILMMADLIGGGE
nr:MAG TPA: hypothetical protein [Caudoviricetes sp.]